MGLSRQEYWSGVPLPSPMINLDSIFESRDITLSTKVHLDKAMFFPVVMYGCESWTIKKASVQFSCSVMSNSFRHHGLQHARLSCPSQLLEPSQTHVHRVGDAIQPSHPLLSPSPPAFNLPQNQDLFQWVSSSHLMAKVLEFQL